jgi:DNA repair photolyase
MSSNAPAQSTTAYVKYLELDRACENQHIPEWQEANGLEYIWNKSFFILDKSSSTAFVGHNIYESISSTITDNISALERHYNKEKENVASFIGNIQMEIDEKVKRIITKTASIGAVRTTIEITDSESILFSLSFEDSKKAYVKVYINDDDSTNEAYFSFYEGKECTYNGLGSTDGVISDLARIYKDKKRVINAYGLSQRTTSRY